MNRRLVGLAAALLLAAVGTFTIVLYVHGADARALDGEKVVDVLVVKKTVPAGTPAEQLGSRVKLESVASKVRAEGAVNDVKQLKGLVAGATLVPGEQVVRARFVSAGTYRATGATVEVPDGMLTTTISLQPDRALGGDLSPGAHVAVAASFDSTANDPAATHLILRKVLVTNVQIAQGSSSSSSKAFTPKAGNGTTDGTNDGTGSSTQAQPGNAPTSNLLVTVAVDAPSAERLIFAAEHGTVWLSLEPTDAPEGATKVVTRGNEYQ